MDYSNYPSNKNQPVHPPPYPDVHNLNGPYGVGGSVNPAQAPYPSGQAPYPAGQAPYPSGQAPYPSAPAPYPAGHAPYASTGYTNQYSGGGFVAQAGAPAPIGHVLANQPNAHGSAEDIEGGKPLDNFGSSFNDKVIRMRFIQRVYIILTCQLLVTVGFICVFIFQEDVKRYVQQSLGLYIAAYVVFLVTYIALVCCAKLRMKFPTNFILLAIFTIALSYMVGMISSFHKTEIVLFSMGICAACCLCVSIFAIQTRFDFTKLGGVLFVIFLVVFFFGILAIIMRHKIMTMVYSGLIALVFMGFLAYDTQLVIGGRKRKYELSPEEYINGALQLYMDVVNIFLAILSLSSNSS